MSDLDAFRTATREWLGENCPESMRQPMGPHETLVAGGRKAACSNPDARSWLERMGKKGWTAPTWPTEYGGGGLSSAEARVLQQEMRALRCRPPYYFFSAGTTMLGPVLLQYGTEEQKRQHLPGIVSGEIGWCQGYSEPGAGSDLANVQCKAVRDGDHYVVNGQKVWTSLAHESDWIFCLVRTDAPKHDGISFLLIDMDSPGVRAVPLELISGVSDFCETFFDDVRVPVANRVGKENEGWGIAKRLLQHERSMLSELGQGGGGPGRALGLPDFARKYLDCPSGPIPEAHLREEITQAQFDSLCFKATMRRAGDMAKAGQNAAPLSTMFKYYNSELGKRRFDLRVRIAGVQGIGWEGEGFDPQELSLAREWLRSKGRSIEGGTSEIQLNIIAKRVLGLPD